MLRPELRVELHFVTQGGGRSEVPAATGVPEHLHRREAGSVLPGRVENKLPITRGQGCNIDRVKACRKRDRLRTDLVGHNR